MNPSIQQSVHPVGRPAEFWQMARAMAVYSARAYTAPVVTDLGTNASALITIEPNLGLAGDNDIVVAFKGSSSALDFKQDAECWRDVLLWQRNESAQPCKAEVHHGFLRDWDAINVAVVSQVKTYLSINPAAKIFITGHSLGGAIVILCAMEFAKMQLPVAGVFTFGQPRVGNKNFCDMYDAAKVGVQALACGASDTLKRELQLSDITFRIVNQNDLVPRLPGWLLGYRHCGQEVFLEPFPLGDVRVNPPLWYKVLADVLGLYAAYRQREDILIREHYIGAYQSRIKYISLQPETDFLNTIGDGGNATERTSAEPTAIPAHPQSEPPNSKS